jgi:uroporphyrinogen-III synthase
VAALKRRGLTPTLVARDPFTSAEVLDALDACELNQARVVLIHYGERSDRLAAALRARGACLDELCLYEWQLPEDTQPMIDLVGDVQAGAVDAVVFTSQVQGRHLLQIAAAMGAEATLIEALNTNVVVAAVGPVCRAALEESGIVADVRSYQSENGPLVTALAEYFRAR